MRITMSEELLAKVRESGGLWRLYGRIWDDGDVAQIMAACQYPQRSGDLLPNWCELGVALVGAAVTPMELSDIGLAEKPDYLLETADPVIWARKDRDWLYCELDIIRPTADFFARTAGVLDSDVLRDKSVAVIGLGSGGSLLAVEMARCGVGRMVLIDYDRLETHNIARHVCGLQDVGRLKTRAVKDMVFDKSPYVTVETHEFDILKDPDRLGEIARSVDLILAATDSEGSKILINQVCLAAGVPAIYGGAYERAMGGDIIKVIPGETPCYDCVIGQIVEELGQPGGGVIDYSTVTDPTQVEAVPGLGIDVSFIALIQAKLALWTLLEAAGYDTPTIDTNYILWGNRPEWIFTQPFQCVLARTAKRESCPSCGYSQSEEEVRRQVAQILEQAAQS